MPTQTKTVESVQDIHADLDKPIALWKSLTAEVLGTFFLVLAATMPVVLRSMGYPISHAEAMIPAGLMVASLILAVGNVSGAHFNPAVTLAFGLRGSFPSQRVPLYWLCQLIGAACGSAMVLFLIGDASGDLGATKVHFGINQAFIAETVLSTLLFLVILGTCHKHKLVGNNAAMAVGATLVLCALIGDHISGASMNPARSFGPALIGNNWSHFWIYVFGPFLGAILASGLTYLLHGPPNDDEQKEAIGHH